MTTSELLSVVLSLAALLVAGYSAVYTRLQARKAGETLAFQQQLARGDAVMHFTDQYFDLLKSGEPIDLISNRDWAYQFWRLHSTEFYFFHHGILPAFMYSLWMIDLVDLYGGGKGQQARDSHVRYLEDYAFHYETMSSFYSEIYRLSRDYSDDATRNRRVAEFVASWAGKHRHGPLALA